MEIELRLVPKDRRRPVPELKNLVFGRLFTEHMFVMEYDCKRGWHSPRIQLYQDLTLDPAAIVLHYAQTIFEGLKAYWGVDGKIRLFRPWENVKRLNRGAERLCMPQVPEDLLLEAIKKLVLVDQAWIPREKGAALYIRPFMFGTEPSLGVKPSHSYLLLIILSPVSAYYQEGFNPVKIYVTEEFVRAAPGGTGEVKAGGNYAASLKAAEVAHKRGYTQVLWLDAVERRYVEEVGTMNIFFYFEDELVTPALSGSILPGITRDSVLHLTREWGLPVSERRVSIEEVIEGVETGRLKECFGTGTAAVISPVGALCWRDQEYLINQGQTGPLARRLFDELTGIQYGEKEDPFGWTIVLD